MSSRDMCLVKDFDTIFYYVAQSLGIITIRASPCVNRDTEGTFLLADWGHVIFR